MQAAPITVIGATSLIGQYLLPKLVEHGFHIQALTRQSLKTSASNITWHTIKSEVFDSSDLKPSEVLIHLAPIWILPQFLPQLATLGIKRLIVFSSTSQFTKQDSESLYEQDIVKKLTDAEAQIKALCNQYGIQWTILRPTLIYGDLKSQDPVLMGKGLATIVKFTKIFHLFPLVSKGHGLRQPVHADDLASACLQVMENSTTFNKAYNLSGAEIIEYRQMVLRVNKYCNNNIYMLSLPLAFVKILLALVRLLPRYRFLTLAMADRMNHDMTFDYADAANDFGYKPQEFLK